MTSFRQYLSGFFNSGTPGIGLFEKPDGTVWLKNPDGSETQVGAGGSQPIQTATVSLTSAELLALADTPKQLVAAPGAGKVIVPVYLSAVSRFVTAGYTIAAAVNVATASGNVAMRCWQLELALTGYDDTDEFSFDWALSSSNGPSGGQGDDLSAVANQGLRLVATGGNPTDGGGGLKVTLGYVTFDAS